MRAANRIKQTKELTSLSDMQDDIRVMRTEFYFTIRAAWHFFLYYYCNKILFFIWIFFST